MRNYILASLVALVVAGGIGLWVAPAEATTYTGNYDWDIVRTTSIPDGGVPQQFVSVLGLGKCTSGNNGTCPAKGTTAAVTPTFAPIVCYVGDGGHVYARFVADTDAMPTTWPSMVSCSYNLGGHTFTANISLHPEQSESNNTNDTHAWIPSDGVTFDFDPLASGAHGVAMAGFRTYPLPSNATYISEGVNAKQTGGATWDYVSCYITEQGGATFDSLVVYVGKDAAAGTGYCPVRRTGQATVNVAVTIDRA